MKSRKPAAKPADPRERRRFPRFRSYNILRLEDHSGNPIENNSTLVNMSEGGLCFYCDDALKPRDRVRINVQISEFHCAVETYARVIWTQPATEHAGTFFTGVEFVGLDESDRDVIRRLQKANRRKAGRR